MFDPQIAQDGRGLTADGLEVAQRGRISEPVARAVWVKAGGRCTLCNRYVLEDEDTGQSTASGQLAHIVGATTGPRSPRGQEPLPAAQREQEANLMLLCHSAHRVIDDLRNTDSFTVNRLAQFKREHEDRIKSLTALTTNGQALVLRCIGKIRDAPIDIPEPSVTDALLAHSRFPSFALRPHGREYEVDLRDLPGEGTVGYWERAAQAIRDQIEPLNRERHALAGRTELAVFAYARIPVLIALGAALDDTITTRIFQRDRTSGSWRWPSDQATTAFEVTTTQAGTRPDAVAVSFSLSAHVDVTRASAVTAEHTVYDIRSASGALGPDVLRSPEDLEAFRACWQGLLTRIEVDHARAASILVLPAVPVSAAVEIGRTPMRGVQPALSLLERDDAGRYQEALRL